ncbi:MAG: hypothetical protein ABIH39_02255 [Candidatus Margulisiibacteriota bacterium]
MKVKNIALFILASFLSLNILSMCPAAEQSPANPFSKQYRQQNVSTVKTTVPKNTLRRKLIKYQQKGQDLLAKHLIGLKKGYNLQTLLILILISFGFGILHSAGPGHGKVIISAYLLQQKVRLSEVTRLSLIIAFIHSGTAILLAILFQTILIAMRGFTSQMLLYKMFSLVSGVLITMIGCWLLFKKVVTRGNQCCEHDHSIKADIHGIGIAAGMVPCPIALTVMLIAIAYNMFFIGLVSVIAMSLGMAFLLWLVGLLVIKAHQTLSDKDTESPGFLLLSRFFSYGSNILIILIGLYMIFMFGV